MDEIRQGHPTGNVGLVHLDEGRYNGIIPRYLRLGILKGELYAAGVGSTSSYLSA